MLNRDEFGGNQPSVFTKKYSGIISEIITNIEISPSEDSDQPSQKQISKLSTLALWDTGATHSAITSSTVKTLGLVPKSMALVHHAGGKGYQWIHYIDIHFPNQVTKKLVRVTECQTIRGNFNVIIGMDIISAGDFALTNKDKKAVFSFMMPSIHIIDFKEEMED